MIPALFCKTAACLDPWVYAISNQRFREELFNICPAFKSKYRLKKTQKQFNTDMETSVATIKRHDSEDCIEEVRKHLIINSFVSSDDNRILILES